MPTTWVRPLTLAHPAARLDPRRPAHARGLADAAGSLETYRYFSRGPAELTEPAMREFIDYLLGPAQTQPFCVIGPGTGNPAGITTYLDIKPAHRGLEIAEKCPVQKAVSTGIVVASKLAPA